MVEHPPGFLGKPRGQQVLVDDLEQRPARVVGDDHGSDELLHEVRRVHRDDAGDSPVLDDDLERLPPEPQLTAVPFDDAYPG